MTSLTCLVATVLALLTIPLVIIWRLSLTPQQNAKRLRSTGNTYKAIGLQLHVSPTTARRYCLA
jgi:ABC-type spermidine/putrescine transport system permease subunit II